MKKAMESLQDLIEEAKLRTVWWILCIFGVTYFLTHTSKSMLMNIPIAILFVSGIRILLNEVEFRWKVQNIRPTSYLSHLEKKQLSVNDSRLTTQPVPQKWKRKIDSPMVEAAAEEFINKILQDFVVDLWYSDITPDKEAPELIQDIIMDALGEVSGRIKDVNLVDLLTRDAVDLVGEHLDLFRRTQAAIGVDVMGTLSSEERDDRLKHQLLASKELHPALISVDYEYKVLQRLMGALLAVVLRPREAQSPLVRCFARELLVCLVMQPVMNFASPWYINELIECIILAYNNGGVKDVASDQSPNMESHNHEHVVAEVDGKRVPPKSSGLGDSLSSIVQDESMHTHHADWAKAFDAATQRRTEVLMPENLENMWAIGRNYKKKIPKRSAPGTQLSDDLSSSSITIPRKRFATDVPSENPVINAGEEDKTSSVLPPRPQQDFRTTDFSFESFGPSKDFNKKIQGSSSVHLAQSAAAVPQETKNKLKRSNSTSDLKVQTNLEDIIGSKGSAPIINEYYSADTNKRNMHGLKSNSDMVLRREGLHGVKLRCRVVGAYFEKLGSKSFAVYSIAVSDADNNTWFVKRRYRNFERLHRHLKDIPNYTLHLPPKRIFSSSTEDAFVHQRCIQLDKYLQELLTIANVAEQHEVWDFLSASSKNYSFGKSPSVMRTLAVNVDDAMDDLVRQFKGVSDGLIWKGTGSPASSCEQSTVSSRNVSWSADAINKLAMMQSTSDSIHSISDNEDGDKVVIHGQLEMETETHPNLLHSDHELNSKGSPPMGVKHDEDMTDLDPGEIHSLKLKSESTSASRYAEPNLALTSVPQEDLVGVPPEWTPPNLSVPILNLVDKIFQLKRRGWLRRQVFWISKQILQLVMEDAIDDWLLRQIQWLRREDVIAQGIRWIQDVLWPNGVFFIKLRAQAQANESEDIEGIQQSLRQASGRRATQPLSFEQQLEAARRANDVKQMLFNGAPTTLVSLIGHKQYRRCARDINYFLQSTVCLKQLGYGILELVLVSVFPELRDVVIDIHQKLNDQSL